MKPLFEQQSKYGIRKLSVGVCSALIGLSLLSGQQVAADDLAAAAREGEAVPVLTDGQPMSEVESIEPAEATDPSRSSEGAVPSLEATSTEERQLMSQEKETTSPEKEVASSEDVVTSEKQQELMASQATGQEVKVGISQITAKTGPNSSTSHILDGNPATAWESVPSVAHTYEGMEDHNRVIDLTLDGTYELSTLTLKNTVDGSYNNYYIYVSENGTDYRRVAAKMDESPATAQGDSYQLSGVRAAYVRLNMAYNSNRFVTNLAELDLRGRKVTNQVPERAPITVVDWENSDWKTKWDRFESDQAYADNKVKEEMSALVGRVIGQEWADKFSFELKAVAGTKDTFEIENRADQGIVIRGNNGIALASGFNYYLKNYAKVDYDPVFASNTKFEGVVPVEAPIQKEANFDHRYALNYTTFSYTMAFWNWDEYEKFLDWSAMNGINLMLDIVGQEEVLRQTLREFNYTDQEIKDYIPGPAYYAWFYMQNLYSIGGPLPDNWFAQRVELGRRIHDRMQTYGIKPVIQAFSGQVPVDFARKNPGAVLSPKDHWPSFVRPAILKTYLDDSERQAGKQDYFSRVADVFYDKQKAIFGDVSHYYSTDPFHEGGNAGNLDITKIYKTVQDKMLAKDPQAIWVLQQWQGNLDARRMRDLDKTKLLALDLQTDMRHEHGLFENNGTPWVYNVLHNFGGRMGADGNLTKVAVDPIAMSKQRQHMVGIGLTAEALENSPAVYGLLFDTNWSDGPINIQAWLDKYAERRAGGDSANVKEAWKLLLETAYRDKGRYYQGAPESVINARPTDRFKAASTWGHSDILYDKEKLDQALKLMLASYDQFKDSEAYRYDVAELAAQVLSNGAKEYYDQMVAARNDRDLDRFNRYANEFLKAIDLSDQLAGATQKFMLGNWINTARKMLPGTDDWTSDLFEANARTIITTWGTEKSGSLKDYSNRKWSGLTADFYKKRWEIWIRNRQAELSGQAKRPEDHKAESNWYLWESRWTNLKSIDDKQFVSQPNVASLGSLARSVLNSHSYTAIRKKLDNSLVENNNLALGKTFETVSTSTAGQPAFLSDGLTDYSWQPKGDGRHVLEVDLEGTYRLDSINLAFPQLATQFPYDLDLDFYDTESQSWKVIEQVRGRQLEANESFSTQVLTNKVRLKISSRDFTNNPVKINDIAIMGHAVSEELINLAQGVPATTSKTNTDPGSPLTNVTDGNTGNLWKTTDWGNNAYPARVSVPVAAGAQVDRVEAVFESAGRPFKFVIKVTELDGSETVVHDAYRDHNGTLPERSYGATIGRAIKAATVEFLGITGQGQFGQSGPALSELKVLGTPRRQAFDDLTKNQLPTTNKTNTDAAYPLSTITDNDTKTFWKTKDWGNAAYPAHISLTAPDKNQVDHLRLVFEKEGLPFKFGVTVTELDGSETLVYDRYRDHNGTLPQKEFLIPINRGIRGARLDYYGITGKGEFYAAGPALAEFNLMGHLKADDYILADYTALNEALKTLPTDLAAYTEASLAPLQALLDTISPNRERHEQAVVNGWREELMRSIQALRLKPADDSSLRALLATVPTDLTPYTADSVQVLNQVLQTIGSDTSNLDLATVTRFENQLRQALTGLVRKPQANADLLAQVLEAEAARDQALRDKQRLEEEALAQAAEKARLEKLLQDIQNDLTAARGDKTDLANQVTNLTTTNQDLANRLAAVTNQLNSLQADKTKLAADLRAAQGRIETLAAQLAAIGGDSSGLTNQLTAAQTALEAAQAAKTRLEDDLAKLAAANQDLANRLTGVTGQVNGLTGDKINLTAALATAQDQIDRLTSQLTTLTSQSTATQEQLTAAQAALASARADKTRLETELANLRTANATLTQDLAGARDQVTGLQGDKTSLTAALTNTQERIEALTAQLATLEGQSSGLQNQLAAAQTALETAQGDKARIEVELVHLRTANQTLAARLEEADRNQDSLRDALDATEEEKARLAATLATLTAENGRLTQELAASRDQVTSLEGDKTSLVVNLATVQDRLDAVTAQLSALDGESSGLLTQLLTAQTALEAALADKARLEAELSQLQTTYADLAAEKAALEQVLTETSELADSAQLLGRLATLEAALVQAQAAQARAAETVAQLEVDKADLEGQLAQSLGTVQAVNHEVAVLQVALQAAQASSDAERAAHNQTLERLTDALADVSDLTERLNHLQAQLAALNAGVPDAPSTVSDPGQVSPSSPDLVSESSAQPVSDTTPVRVPDAPETDSDASEGTAPSSPESAPTPSPNTPATRVETGRYRDEATGVQVQLSGDDKAKALALVVQPKGVSEIALESRLSHLDLDLYDIYFVDKSGQRVQITDSAQLTLPVRGLVDGVYYIAPTGLSEALPFTQVDANHVTTQVTHFSYYGVVYKPVSQPASGEVPGKPTSDSGTGVTDKPVTVSEPADVHDSGQAPEVTGPGKNLPTQPAKLAATSAPTAYGQSVYGGQAQPELTKAEPTQLPETGDAAAVVATATGLVSLMAGLGLVASKKED